MCSHLVWWNSSDENAFVCGAATISLVGNETAESGEI